MSVYLHDVPLPDALTRFQQALEKAGLNGALDSEEILLDENAVGRVTAAPVWALISSPHYHASAMDGFAIHAEDTVGAEPSRPVLLRTPDKARYVDTGDPLPDWANAVVPIENTEGIDLTGNLADDVRHPAVIRLRASLVPWAHVRPMGEDIVATQLVLPSGHLLRPVDLGAMAAAGNSSVCVYRKPRVAILPTGTELVPIGTRATSGQIIEFNSIVLAGQVHVWGGIPTRMPATADHFELLKERVREAASQHDLVLVNAGSSAGSEDFTAGVIEELGEVLVHGVAVRPGHPVILGLIHSGENRYVPIIGVPGYPVSAALTAEIFIEPLLAQWGGRPPVRYEEIEAEMTRKIASPGGDDDYVRVVVGQVGTRTLAAPLPRGAGVITSLARADGILVLPRGVQGVEAGTHVSVRLYRRREELAGTIFTIGSHDMTLDLLAQQMPAYHRRLISSNVGSIGGLIALRRGEAHFAGSHLLDPVTGEYNVSFLPQYLPDVPVRLVVWAGREQGLIVPKGNPKAVNGLADLARSDVRYINRQRGAGTRLLLDYHIQQAGFHPEQINGYNQEEYTHLGVAAAVASGRADCGLGITAAAKALDLDFVPLFQERYDLVIPCVHLESGLLDPVLETMSSPSFRTEISAMPGYDVSRMGEVIIDCSG